jgi:hypothetical protein
MFISIMEIKHTNQNMFIFIYICYPRIILLRIISENILKLLIYFLAFILMRGRYEFNINLNDTIKYRLKLKNLYCIYQELIAFYNI